MRSSPSILASAAFVVGCSQDEPELPAPKGPSYGPPITVSSSAFADGESIPDDYTCEGDNVSPPLSWSNAPDDTSTFALVVDDPDAPKKVWVHWVVWSIAGDVRELPQGIVAGDDTLRQGTNDSDKVGWSGPCPPKADDDHHYVFHLFAVDITPDLPGSTTRDELYRALDHHVLSMGELTGLFGR